MSETFRYDAFISYRHCELDSFISENLHKKLENFKLPKSVIKKTSPSKTKIERVFRDEAELPLSNNLSDPISEALANSEFLIVICTPNLPKSEWCKKEIETFVQLHDRKHVLLVLADGEPDETFPEILTYEDLIVQDENGRDVTVRVDREPLAADCRGANNKERLKALDNVVLKLCAAMFNLNYDDLKQRHRERQIRRRLIFLSAALAIVTAFAVTCLFFSIRISRQNKIIRDKYAGTMAAASSDLLSRGLRKDALYAVRNVLPKDERDGYNADAYTALVDALAPYEIENNYFPAASFPVPQDLEGFSVSEDLKLSLINGTGFFSVIDIFDESELCRIDCENSALAILNDTGVVYPDDDFHIVHFNPVTGETTVLADEGYDLYYVPEEKITLVFSENGIAGYKNLSELFSIDYEDYGIDGSESSVEDFFVAEGGTKAAFILEGFDEATAGVIDLEGGRLQMSVELPFTDEASAALDDINLYLCYEKDYDYMTGIGETGMQAVNLSTEEITSADLPGTGFYDMIKTNIGIQVISDRLSFIYDEELNCVSTISGYQDAVCAFAYEDGSVILDKTGNLILDSLYPNPERSFELYGHEDTPFISNAVFAGDTLYVKYPDSMRIVAYTREPAACEPMEDMGKAVPFDSMAEWDIASESLKKLEKTVGKKLNSASLSGDGKYVAVDNSDGTICIFDVNGVPVKEIRNSGIFILHRNFPYLKEADVYVLENCVFDQDFNLISHLPDGEIAGIGKDQKSLVLLSRYSPDVYYKVPILPYDEILEEADSVLSSYVPDRSILEKYSIE